MQKLRVQVVGGALLLGIGILVGMQIRSEPGPTVTGTASPPKSEWRKTSQLVRPRVAVGTLESAKTKAEPAEQAEAGQSKMDPELSQEAHKRAQSMIESGLQLEDSLQREEAIESIRRALQSGEAVENYAGVMAFLGLTEVEFDKKAFRELLLPHLQAEDPGMRQKAWYALFNADPQEVDIARIWEMADEPGMETSISHLLMLWEKRDLTGESGAVVARLLQHEDPGVRKEIMRGLWGGFLSDELSARVEELADPENGPSARDALYFALTTQANKTPDGVERLIDYLSHPDTINVAGRALWGLKSGVPEESYPRVVEAAISLIESRGGRMREGAMGLVTRYARAEQLPALQALMDKPGLDAGAKASLAKLMEGMAE